MKGKRRCLFIIVLIINLFILNRVALPENLSEPYPLSFLSIVRYYVVESNWYGDINIRTLRLEVNNTTNQKISNIKAVIDGLPENVTSNDAEVVLGDMNGGETKLSNDTFQISVDMSPQRITNLKLIWKVECDINGERIIDETAVIETLQ